MLWSWLSQGSRPVQEIRLLFTQPVSGSATKKLVHSITFLPNCEFVENEHRSSPPAQETERTDWRRTSGMIVGSWPSQGLAAHAVRSAAGSPAPKFRKTFLGKKVVYPPAN
jgi:hypothetical protein